MRMSLLALAAVLLGVVAVAAADDDKAKQDLKLLAGTWKVTAGTVNGTDANKDEMEKFTLTVTAEGKWELKQDGKAVLGGTVKLDPSKSPKTLDWTVLVEGEEKGKLMAIYEVTKDTFKNCFVNKGDRPTKFESKEGTGVSYYVYQRVKK